MKSKSIVHLRYPLLVLSLLLLVAPFPSLASSSRLSCELSVKTDIGEIAVQRNKVVTVAANQEFEIIWESTGAKKAFDSDGETIPRSGSATTTVTEPTTYTYTFLSGSTKKKCTLDIVVVNGTIASSSLTAVSHTPTITGTASGTKSILLKIYKEGDARVLYKSKAVHVKNGVWSTKVTKSLKEGVYTVELLSSKKSPLIDTLATSSLTITKKTQAIKTPVTTPQSSTTFVVESVPLLIGGTAKKGMTVPVSYLQVINIGKTPGNVESITLKQNGSAPTNVVTELSVFNERGLLSTHTGLSFVNGVATIPVTIPLAAQEMQLLTLKATLAPELSMNVGKQMKLDVTSVATNGAMQSVFPIRGTTWTLAN